MKTLSDLSAELRTKLSKIELLLMDVDGVLADGFIRIDDNGVESKSYSTRDGLGLMRAKKYGLTTGVISGRKSHATEIRCQCLKIEEIHLGLIKKLPVFEEILKRRNLIPQQTAYIGDDLIDLPILTRAGVSAAPNDAHDEVLRQVDIVLDRPGGNGAVRHFLDLWLMSRGLYEQSIEDVLHGNI